MSLSPEQTHAIDIARSLITAGIPVFAAPPALDAQGEWDPNGGTGGCGYHLPSGWERTVPTDNWLNPNANGWSAKAWRPGWALGAVMGHGLDLLDIDPRNGGDETVAGLKAAGLWPSAYGSAATPSGGTHDFVASMRVGSRDRVQPGFDVKGGAKDGTGRGFAFIAPTVKASKVTGELVPYTWTSPPDDLSSLREGDSSVEGIAELVRQSRASRKERGAPALSAVNGEPVAPEQASVYIDTVVRRIQHELRACHGQDSAWTDDKGRGWEKVTADAAHRLGALARADWNALTLDEARGALLEAAPTDSGWTRRDVEEKWRAQYDRAEPARPPTARLGDDVFGPTPWTASAPTAALSAPGTGAELSRASWAPADLTAFLAGTHVTPTPTLLRRTDGQALLYPGLVHSLHGESESGKSLVLQMLTAELLAAGRKVAFIDFESDVASVCGRLLLFGATREGLRDHLDYIKPEVNPGMNTERDAWNQLMQQRYELVVIDGVTDALAVFGKATKDNDDITTFTRAFPKQVSERTGAAVVMVDHVTKDTESRGRYAIGGQAKMNGLTGAAYVVEIDEALGKGLRGVIVLRVGKDRPGEIRQACGPMRKSDRTQEAARIVVDSRNPARPVWTVEPWRDSTADATAKGFRPTVLMEAACQAVERNAGATKNGIVEVVGKNKRFTMQAIDLLVNEGYLRRETGSNNSQRHYVERVYRQATDARSPDYLGGSGTTAVVSRVVCGSSPYTGGAGTTRSVVLEPLPEPPGTTAQNGVSQPTAEDGPCSGCQRTTRKYGPDGAKFCDACQLTREPEAVA